MASKKVAVIGAGYVGSSIAYALTLKEIAQEIVLIDIEHEKAKGEAMDIVHGIPYMAIQWCIRGITPIAATAVLLLLRLEKNRKRGQSRLDLLEENTDILKNVAENIMQFYNGGVILVVSNPVDMMTCKMTEWCGLDDGKILGTGCILDTSRLVGQLASYLRLSTDSIHAMVVGEHGDFQMPVWSRVMIGNAPIAEYCHMMEIPWNDQIQQQIFEIVLRMGAEIISRKERTHFGIATCVCYLAESIIYNQDIVVPVSSVLRGEYDISGVALSVPSILAGQGIKKRLVERWAEQEIKFIQTCAERMRRLL